jgi:hypothetical protein
MPAGGVKEIFENLASNPNAEYLDLGPDIENREKIPPLFSSADIY